MMVSGKKSKKNSDTEKVSSENMDRKLDLPSLAETAETDLPPRAEEAGKDDLMLLSKPESDGSVPLVSIRPETSRDGDDRIIEVLRLLPQRKLEDIFKEVRSSKLVDDQ